MYIVIIIRFYFFKQKKKTDKLNTRIHMHSVQNPNYICFFFFWKKNSWPRTLEQVAIWPRVRDTRGGLWPHGFQTRGQIVTCINSRGHMDTCNKYTCPNGHVH
jgi:hypothetical protein